MEIKPGKYRHFKGNYYEVIGVARHSETMEEMVVYRALYGEHGLWVRPAAMWTETIDRDGAIVKGAVRIADATIAHFPFILLHLQRQRTAGFRFLSFAG